MSFDSRSLLRRLQELQLQIAATPQQGESLRAALDGHDLGEAICATMDAERHVLAMAATIADILAQVVPADHLGAVESLSELVFRAVRMVVLTELSMLREVVCEASKRGKLRPLTWGRFRGIDHLTSEMRDEIHRITHQWIAYREMEGVERVTYRAALRAAHQSMRQLGNASEATRFLHEGRTRADWPALREVCSRIWVALTIRINADPDRPLLVHEMRAIATLLLSTELAPTEPAPNSAVIEEAEAGGEATPALPLNPPPAAAPDKAGTR